MTLEDCRRFYAEEIRLTAALRSDALAEAYAHVPREKFLGPGPWRVASADQRVLSAAGLLRLMYTPVTDPRQLYHNVVIVLDESKDINNGQPGALARWMDALDLSPGDRVFHLGCGLGYYTAILAEVVGPGGHVVASELEPGLAERARENLAAYPQVEVHAGDGAALDPGPCDAILINAGVTEPGAVWLDRLREGGRLVLPLTISLSATLGQGVMLRIERRGAHLPASVVSPVAIFSCSALRDADGEAALRKALTTGGIARLKSLRRDAHEPGASCLAHGPRVCLSAASPDPIG